MKKLLLFSLLFVFFSCSKKKTEIPADVIPFRKMKEILIDVQLSQAASANSALVDSFIYNNKEYMVYVLQKHQIKREEFLRSLKFYTSNPEILQEIYDSVLVDLSKIQSESQIGK